MRHDWRESGGRAQIRVPHSKKLTQGLRACICSCVLLDSRVVAISQLRTAVQCGYIISQPCGHRCTATRRGTLCSVAQFEVWVFDISRPTIGRNGGAGFELTLVMSNSQRVLLIVRWMADALSTVSGKYPSSWGVIFRTFRCTWPDIGPGTGSTRAGHRCGTMGFHACLAVRG